MGAGLGAFSGGIADGFNKSRAITNDETSTANSLALGQSKLALEKRQQDINVQQQNMQRADAAVAQLTQAMTKTHDSFTDAGHPPEDFAPMISDLAQHASDLYSMTGRPQQAQAIMGIAKAMTSRPADDSKEKWQACGTDPVTGKTSYCQTNPAAPGGVTKPNAVTTASNFLPKDADGNLLQGQDAYDQLKKTDPGRASRVTMWLQGKQPLPTAFAMARDPTLKEDVATAQQIDGNLNWSTQPALMQASKEWNSTKPNTPGYAISGASGSVRHLAEWSDHIAALNNYDTGLGATVTHGANAVFSNLNPSQDRKNSMAAATQAAEMYSPEVQKLLTNNVGTGEERDRRVAQLTDFNAPPQENAKIALTQVRLTLEKSARMLEDYHQKVTPLFDPGLFTQGTLDAYNKIFANILKMDPSLKGEIEATKAEYIPAQPVQQPETMANKAVPPGGGQIPPQAAASGAPAAPAPAPAAAQPTQKIINGNTYVKKGGQWFPVGAP